MVLHDRGFVALLLTLAALLLFTRLDDRFLWQDEAETAVLAKSVLSLGVPTAWDGRNLVSQESGQEFRSTDHRWFWTPWLQHYATALAFVLIGPSTWSARLPFVLFGIGALYLTYVLAWAISRERRVARVASLLLLGNVPFLLHARQCRYYAPAAFFTLLLVAQYLRALEGRRGAYAGVVLAAVGLFHSHYVVCAGIGAGLALHFALVDRRRAICLRFLACAGVTFVLTLPFLLGFIDRGAGQALPGLDRSLASLGEAVFHLNRYAMPFVLPVVALAAWLGRRRAGSGAWQGIAEAEQDVRTRGGLAIACAGIVCVTLLLAVMPWFFFRYYVPLIPLAAIGQALLFSPWLRAKPRATLVLALVLLITTDLAGRLLPIPHAVDARSTLQFQTGDEQPGIVVGTWASWIPMAGYLYEITHDHVGPIEALVEQIEPEVELGQVMLATYGDLPIQFYLPSLRVVGGLSGEDPRPYRDADWLFVRAHTHRSGDARLKRFIASDVDRARYEPVHLGVADLPYENRPDPTYHKFRQAEIGEWPEAKVWRRIPEFPTSVDGG